MIGRIRQGGFLLPIKHMTGRAYGWLVPALKQSRILQIAFAATLSAVFYWGLIASDRYISEAHIVILSTDGATKSADTGSLITGAVSGNKIEQYLLRDHLLSIDMMQKLDAKLDLRGHYSDTHRDLLSRMWSKDESLERFYQYYLSHVSVEFDEFAGVLVVHANAYDPQTAHAITSMLVEEGERAMNDKAHELAREQVSFAKKEVAQIAEQLQNARQAVLAFQNKHGLVSPESTAENVAGGINRLESVRTDLQTRRTALLGYLSPQAPAVVDIDMQLSGIEKQLIQEKKRLTASKGTPLNSVVEEYQRLEMAAGFAEQEYKVALGALAKTQIEATRTLRKVLVLQSPTLPQYPLGPRRIYNIIVFILSTLLITGILQLLAAIIRDHKD